MRGASHHFLASALLVSFSILLGNRQSSAEPAEYSVVLIRPDTTDVAAVTRPDGMLEVPVERPPTEPESAATYSSRLVYLVGQQDDKRAHLLQGSLDTDVLEDGSVLQDGSQQETSWSLGDKGVESDAVVRIGRGLKSVQDSSLTAESDENLSRVLDDEDDRRKRRAFNLFVRRDRRADEGGSPAAGFLPPQLQAMAGNMKDSAVVVGVFEAMVMPGSAATGMGEQVSGLLSNMPGFPGGGR